MISTNTTLQKGKELLRKHSCFNSLNEDEIEKIVEGSYIAHLLHGESVVKKDQPVDSFYVIVEGEAEVYTEIPITHSSLPIALLASGETIGLAGSGLFSKTGKRTATVIARTDLTLLKVDLNNFKNFLSSLEDSILKNNFFTSLLRVDFLKKISPFQHFEKSQLESLNQYVCEVPIAKNEIIFNEGEKGEYCYFVVSGTIAITRDKDIEIARIGPMNYFGETALLSDLPRNATAKALDDSLLLSLNKDDFLKLIHIDKELGKAIFKTQIQRGCPRHSPGISVHPQIRPDGDKIYILKNKENGKYFQLSEQGLFIWNQLNGHNTFRDLSLKMFHELNVFDPNYVFYLIMSLHFAGFIYLPSAKIDYVNEKLPFWKNIILSISDVMQANHVFVNNDAWLSKSFSTFFHHLYSPGALISFLLILIIGLSIFVIETPSMLTTLSKDNLFLYIFASMPLMYLTTCLHELSHAYTVKYFGRDVNMIGVGWFWVTIVFFVDTSDMWTATKKQRLLVNSAGIFAELVFAGIIALTTFFITNVTALGILWFFCFSVYLAAVLNLCPLLEFDGYYILMDILNKPNLRTSSIAFLANVFTNFKSIDFKHHKAEIAYWVCCILYIICGAAIMYFIQNSVFKQFFPEYIFNLYVWLLPLMFLVISFAAVIIQFKRYRELKD